MSTTDELLETLRDLMKAGNPGLVTKDDLRALEHRLEELEELVEELAERVTGGRGKPTAAEDEDEEEDSDAPVDADDDP